MITTLYKEVKKVTHCSFNDFSFINLESYPFLKGGNVILNIISVYYN